MSASNACQLSGSCNEMPDIASEPHNELGGTLNWVGMSEIEMPVYLKNRQQEKFQTLANIQAYVNLIDPSSKGIHMSRLYVALDQLLSMETLSPELLKETLKTFVDSHQSLSDSAFLDLSFDYYEKRDSLLSKNSGWKSYPVKITASLRHGKLGIEINVDVPYSSTCPCSAALARQLIQDGFQKHFNNAQNNENMVHIDDVHNWLGTTHGISATPHSQRSIAQVRVKLADTIRHLPISSLIDCIEDALKTPVQAVVKREDEQEFARLNGQNLMFCEDASRRLKHTLNDDPRLFDFWLRVNHMESLHAHDAVAVAVKGIKGGYSDHPRHAPC